MIALFQDQIAEHQTLAEHYRELAVQREKLAASLLAIEEEATGAFQAIANIKQKIQDSKAIASLKLALLNLFDDGGNDDGGNKSFDPAPDTDPTNLAGDDEEELEEVSEEDSEDEDSGEEKLIYHPDNSAIAWIPDESEDGKLTVVVGLPTKAIAQSWLKFIEPMALAVDLGQAKFTGFKWELYCYGLSLGQISRLATECDFSKAHVVKADKMGTAKPSESKKKYQSLASSINIGSKVTRLLTPGETFEVTSKVAADGTFFAKSELNGNRQLFNVSDVSVVTELPEGTPKYATVLLADCQWRGQLLKVVSQGDGGYTLETPEGKYWYSLDSVQICDEEIEAIADATEPVHSITKRPNRVQPAFGSASGGLEVQIKEPAGVIAKGDIVEIISDRYPQFLNQTGTVEDISSDAQTPISVRSPRGVKPYHRSDLKLISKALSFPSESEDKELVAAGSELEF